MAFPELSKSCDRCLAGRTDGGAIASLNLPQPQPGRQSLFYECDADVIVFGGAAGSAKSSGLLIKAARYLDVTGYGAVLFRRTSGELRNDGGLVDQSRVFYDEIAGGVYRETFMDWEFPTGSSISFGYADKLKERYTGSQIGFVGIDEGQFWSESEINLLLSRNRSTSGVKPQLCITCNPDPDCYVATLVEWWINPITGYPIEERAGIVRYFYRIDRTLYWADTPDELEERFPDLSAIAPPKSFTFIPGTIYDNPILLKANPQYLATLLSLPKTEMERLLRGNWKITDSQVSLFDEGAIARNSTGFWLGPIPHHAYLMACDPNFGAIGGDYFVVQMWDITRFPAALCFEYRDNEANTTTHRQEVAKVAERYRPCLAAVERNGGGQIVAENLVEDCPWLRVETVQTGALSKRINSDRVAIALENDEVVYPDDWAGIKEMAKFSKINREALSGHDDTITAWMTAWAWLEEAYTISHQAKGGAVADRTHEEEMGAIASFL